MIMLALVSVCLAVWTPLSSDAAFFGRRSLTSGSAPEISTGPGVFDFGFAQIEVQKVSNKFHQPVMDSLPGMNEVNDITALLISGDFPYATASNDIFQAEHAVNDHENFTVVVLPDNSRAQEFESLPPPPTRPISVPPTTNRGFSNVLSLLDWISGDTDVLYYGPMEFGTPQQILTVDIDTGSADLWVPGSGCTTCSTQRKFDEGASSTFRTSRRNKFSITYGTGSARGTLVSDHVSMAGMYIANQTFGLVTSLSSEFNDGAPNDGLFGMAFGTIARSGKPTFFENLMVQGKLEAPFFSVHLERGRERGSALCLGCYDATKVVGGIYWIPVVKKTYWAISLEGLVAGETVTEVSGVIAAIDTGTTWIYVPEKAAEAFYKTIPGARAWAAGFYTYPCATSLTVSLRFGSRSFYVNPTDFNLGRTEADSVDCVGGILSLDEESGFPQNLAIVGAEFLKSWHSTYDYSHGARVGFSASVNNIEVRR